MVFLQDAIDLVHGQFIVSVSRGSSSQPQKGGLEAFASLPVALSVVMAGFFLALMSLRQAPYSSWHLFLSLFWAVLSAGIAAFVRANGRSFCNRPRLHKV
uniref:Uncharacterized protein n=1 Tax=Opuntia streptacantha TaxID=393608 RepID=A0A7C9A087_OPUST